MTQIHEYFRDYTLAHQYDAEQCLRTILEICYPDIQNAAFDTEFDYNKFDSQFIFRVTYNEEIECEQRKGGCGNTQNNYEHHQILKLTINERSEFEQSVEQLLNSPANRDPMPQGYRCDIQPLPCNKYNTCNKQSILSGLKDVLIIQLIIYSHDEHITRKFFPELHINQRITQFAQYNLKAIIWHHGDSLQSGHYTAMVKQRNEQWIHISDTDKGSYPIKFYCREGEESVPYILFYTKAETNVNNVPLSIEESESESESIDFKKHNETTNTERLPKRTHEPSIDDVNEDNLNYVKSKKLKTDLDCENDILTDTEETFIEIDDQPEKPVNDEYDENSISKTFNFPKRKKQFSGNYLSKKAMKDRIRKREKRATDERRKEYNEYQKNLNETLRSTHENKEKYNE